MENLPLSPCIKLCEIDNQTQLCKGCYRTISEITDWGSLTNKDKEIIYKEIEKRKLIKVNKSNV